MKPSPTETPPKKLSDDAEDAPQEAAGLSEQDRIDEAMAESFPASDPPSWNAGVKHKEDELTEDGSK